MTILTVDERRACYQRFEKVLQQAGLDYVVHILPATDSAGDPTDFEEYWVTNREQPTKLFPVMAKGEANAESEMSALAAQALKAHSAIGSDLTYYMVLCGSGWSTGQAASLQSGLSSATQARVLVQTLDEFEASGM